jgi:hypothetical protein
VSPEIKAEVIAALRKFRAPARVARSLGLDLSLVLAVNDEIGGSTRNLRREEYDGYGRVEFRPFIVGRKRAYLSWDNTEPKIAAARAAYEAGTHDMMTGRDGDWLLLYSIPQRRITPRPNYFKPEI